MMKLGHMVNPVIAGPESDLRVAQPITFETMKVAKDFASGAVEVDLLAACYPEDQEVVPEYFKLTKVLERDVGEFGEFRRPRKLPLIKDILDRLADSSDAEYFIYSNVDISVQPYFYLTVAAIISQGYESFTINRRTIPKKYGKVSEIPLMYAEAGEKHPGYDCFVFKRDLYDRFKMGSACVGANWIGRVILSNLMANTERFIGFEDLHATFHIGDERSWKIAKYRDYDDHNEKELLQILRKMFYSRGCHHRSELKDFVRFHTRLSDKEKGYSNDVAGPPKIPADIVDRNTPIHIQGRWVESLLPVPDGGRVREEAARTSPLRQDPVFVVGYPRSGTTLIQALLATQKSVFSLPETHFFDMVMERVRTDKRGCIRADCLDAVFSRIRERTVFSKQAEEYLRACCANQGASPKMLFEMILVDNLIYTGHAEKIHGMRWVEKTPDHVLHLKRILEYYPEAKIVYVMRHPEKAIISRRKYFTWNNEAAWPIERHAKKWLDSVRKIEQYISEKEESVTVVRLEDVVKDYRNITESMCRFLNIAYEGDRVEKYREVSKTLYYPWESWKADASSDISEQIANNKMRLSWMDRLRLWMLAGRKMKEYGYSPLGSK